MIVQITAGAVVSTIAGVLVMLFLRQKLGPVLLSAILLGTVVASPFVILVFISPLNVEALIFWVIPLIALTILLPTSRYLISTETWPDEKRLSAQRLAVFFLWIAFGALSVGGASLLIGGENSEAGLLIMFMMLVIFILFGALGSFVFAITVGKSQNRKGTQRTQLFD